MSLIKTTTTTTTTTMLDLWIFEAVTDSKPLQVVLFGCLLLGVSKLTITVLNLGSLVADLLVLPKPDFRKYGSNKKCWGIVTGASDGIGKEFAEQLAAKGFNLVLISRTLSKLEAVALELSDKYQVSTKVISVDVTDVDDAIAKIKAQLASPDMADLPISVLINNVGQSHSIPVPFVECDDKELSDIININNLFTLKLTKLVIPRLIETNKLVHTKSLIVTMGSFGGLLPTPYLSVYSGSKVFLQNWSNCLATELKLSGIDVEFILSYLVTSAMSKIRKSSWLIPNPKQFVKLTLGGLGRRNGSQDRYATNTPYWSHALMHFGISQTVGVYSKIANELNFNMHKSIRQRALKKAARIAAEKKQE